MSAHSLEQLLRTVEIIRGEMKPHLDSQFLSDVIRAEDNNPEDDQSAIRAIQVALNESLQRGRSIER